MEAIEVTMQAVLRSMEVIVQNQAAHTRLLATIVEAATRPPKPSELPAALERLKLAVDANTNSVDEMIEGMVAMPPAIERMVTHAVEVGVSRAVNGGVVED